MQTRISKIEAKLRRKLDQADGQPIEVRDLIVTQLSKHPKKFPLGEFKKSALTPRYLIREKLVRKQNQKQSNE